MLSLANNALNRNGSMISSSLSLEDEGTAVDDVVVDDVVDDLVRAVIDGVVDAAVVGVVDAAVDGVVDATVSGVIDAAVGEGLECVRRRSFHRSAATPSIVRRPEMRSSSRQS